MYRFFCALILLLMVGMVCPGHAAEKSEPALTQREFGRMIVSQFGWADGLPKEPVDRDYLVILGGKRTFRYEAENAYNVKTDNVTVRNFTIFGPFTGKGWLMGVSETTSANFVVQLPIGGEFSLRAVIKGQGFAWKIGDKVLQGSSPAGGFADVDLGKITLKPGVVTIKVTIPPEGAIDSFAFIAKDYNAVQPFGGWRFSEPLTARRMAEIGIALRNAYDKLPLLPKSKATQISAADIAAPLTDAAPTTTGYLGPFTSKTWLRANFRGTTFTLPFKITEAGFYIVRSRVLGERVSGELNGIPFDVSGKPYLDMTDLGLFRLEAGDNMLTLKVPPMGGIDSIELQPKSSAPADVMALAGLSGDPERPVKKDEALAFISAIREKYPVRK